MKNVNILKVLPTFIIKSTHTIACIFAALPFLLVLALYIVDKVYANGLYLGTLMSYLVEVGISKDITVVDTAILLGLCLILLILKVKIRRVLRALHEKSALLKAIFFSVGNVIINILLMFGVLILLTSSVVFGYINTVFDSYFDSTQSVTYVDKIGYIQSHIQDSKISASLVLHKIMLDIQSDPEYVSNLSNEDYKALCYEINELIVQKEGPETLEEHYFRNYFDRAPETLDEMIETIQSDNSDFGWQLMPISDSLFHMNGEDGEYNLKFVSEDGFFEAVYNKDGNLLTAENDPVNMGTYNYADPVSDAAEHSLYDVVPYLIWGNTLLSNFTLEENLDYEQYENNPDAQARYLKITELLYGEVRTDMAV